VDDALDPLHGPLQVIRAADVALDKLKIAVRILRPDIRELAIEENDIQHRGGDACAEETPDDLFACDVRHMKHTLDRLSIASR
jgi:hypothetical protein